MVVERMKEVESVTLQIPGVTWCQDRCIVKYVSTAKGQPNQKNRRTVEALKYIFSPEELQLLDSYPDADDGVEEEKPDLENLDQEKVKNEDENADALKEMGAESGCFFFCCQAEEMTVKYAEYDNKTLCLKYCYCLQEAGRA